MAIEFECPVCEATIRVKDEAAGKKGRCPKCKTLLLVPDPGPEEEAAPPASPEAVAAAAEPAVPPPAAAPQAVPVDVPAAQPLPPSPVVVDPSSPFGIVPEEEPVMPAVVRRKGGGVPTMKIVSAAAGVLCIGAVLLIGWLLYRSSEPELSGPISGERLKSVTLVPASFEVPGSVPKEVAGRAMAKLAVDELALKSEYAAVTLQAVGDRVEVTVEPGPQAAAVRVPLGENAAVKAALVKKKREAIAGAKRKELDRAAAAFVADYDAYATEKKPLMRASEYRDAVALNATTDVVGYSVEAVIAGHPFRCVAEDADGNCYFFLPVKTKKFQIRGRELPDGTKPLPVDFEVTVKEGAGETVRVETEEPEKEPEKDAAETKPEEPASESMSDDPTSSEPGGNDASPQ